MTISFDPAKRAKTLAERKLDMAQAGAVFAAPHITLEDDRFDYGERRNITIGRLNGRMVVLVWTSRHGGCRIISMRKANDREQRLYGPRLEGSRLD